MVFKQNNNLVAHNYSNEEETRIEKKYPTIER